MDRLAAMITFVRVAESGSFAAAAGRLGVARSVITRQIAALEEHLGIKLMVRITARLQPGDIARKLGTARLKVIATPAYLARHGQPGHPAELADHSLIGYTHRGVVQPWAFRIDGEVKTLDLPFRLQANNGEALAEAAALDLGITSVPDFVAQDYLRNRGMVTLLDDFTPPDLGIYALLPSNRYMPHRVRALIEFLSQRMRCPRSDLDETKAN